MSLKESASYGSSPVNFKGRKALVTGGGGFIGSHLVEALLDQGADVTAFVRYRSDGSCGWLDSLSCCNQIEVIKGDLEDRVTLDRACSGQDYIFHLGAQICVPYSMLSPYAFVNSNIIGTLNVLNAALKSGARLLVTSSSEVYGIMDGYSLSERHYTHARSVYAATKIGGDALAQAYYHQHGLPVTIVRPFNTFGPRQSQRAAVASFILQALAKPEVVVYHPDSRRDWVYVKDTVNGFLCASVDHAIGRSFNFGTGDAITVKDLADQIVGLVSPGKTVTVQSERERPGTSELETLRARNADAKFKLGWLARYSLEDGLQETVDWFREHVDCYQRAGEFAL